jgi:flagellar transcriptional activator FlhD
MKEPRENMQLAQLQQEIREANLAYLMLAKEMILEDRAEAAYRLGISEELAIILGSLSAGQIVKIAASDMLVCRFRFDDRMLWDLIAGHSKEHDLGGVHAAILLSGQAAETA